LRHRNPWYNRVSVFLFLWAIVSFVIFLSNQLFSLSTTPCMF